MPIYMLGFSSFSSTLLRSVDPSWLSEGYFSFMFYVAYPAPVTRVGASPFKVS